MLFGLHLVNIWRKKRRHLYTITLCQTDTVYYPIRPQKAHVLGEDLVPEQENEVEEQQRARTAGSGEKMALSCCLFFDILNLIYFSIFSILLCCVPVHLFRNTT